jgi:hypothetical protein
MGPSPTFGTSTRDLVRRLGGSLAGLGLAAIMLLTLFPNPGQVPAVAITPLLCLVCGESGSADVLLNILLFMPLGAGLRLLGWPWRRVAAAAALLSLGVEATQHFVLPGRDASLSDVITNTTGGTIGAALASRLGLLLVPGPAAAGRLAGGAALAWLGVLAFTALAMSPWAPAEPLRGYCTASYRTGESFSGTARSATLNGVEVPCDADLPPALAEGMRGGDLTLNLEAATGHPSDGRQLVYVVRAPRASLVVVAQNGRALLFSAPTFAQRLRLYPPLVRLPEAVPGREGVPVEIHAEVRGRRMRLAAAAGGPERTVELALSPAQGWTTVLQGGLEPGTPLRLAAALWLGFLLLPAGYWAGFTARPARGMAGVIVLAAAGLALVPRLTGFEPSHWSEWLGAGVGAAVGWALSRFAAYLQSRCGSPSTSAFSSS